MTIASGSGQLPIAGSPTFFAFNAVDPAHAGAHFNFQVDETFTMRVMPRLTVTLAFSDSNCRRSAARLSQTAASSPSRPSSSTSG